MKLEVCWRGGYPSLCCGIWIIKYKDKELYIPEDIRTGDMNTYGEYSRWYFDDNYCEQDEYYNDGLEFEEWIKINEPWLHQSFNKIGEMPTRILYEELYALIQENDFRSGSCGGCI